MNCELNRAAREAVLEAYFRERMEPCEIAAAMHLTEAAVRSALEDAELLAPYGHRAEAARLRAQICLYENAEAAARLQARLLHGEDGAASQRAAKEILDRTGVKAQREERREVTLRLVGDVPRLGMPGEEAEDKP